MTDFLNMKRLFTTTTAALAKIVTLDDRPPSTPLFHYTDAAGFIGIVEGKAIRATHYRYLNDTEEMHAGERAVEEVAKKMAVAATSALQKAALKLLVEEQSILTQMKYAYLASFSENGNLLSQWRAYGGNGAGYSIGLKFDDVIMHPVMKLQLCKCEYDLFAFKTRVRDTFSAVLNELEQLARASGCSEQGAASVGRSLLLNVVPSLVPALKSDAFIEEKEWRLVAFSANDLPTGVVKFRPCSRRGIIPYAQIPLCPGTQSRLNLAKAYVGPTLDSETATKTAQIFLEGQGYQDCAQIVSSTGIPYRS